MSKVLAVAKAIEIIRESGTSIDFESVVRNNYSRILRRGDIAIDFGAHEGKHLAPMIDLVGPAGKVIGVEPLPQMYSSLQAQFGQHANVVLHNLAVANYDGETTFKVFQGGLEESGLLRKLHHSNADNIVEIPVKVARADTLLAAEAVARFIKIDVEGAEILLLESARSYLKRSRPFVCIEYGFPNYSAYGNDKMSLYNFSKSEGYILADLYGNFIDSVDVWEKICDWSYWDYMMVPSEKAEEYKSFF